MRSCRGQNKLERNSYEAQHSFGPDSAVGILLFLYETTGLSLNLSEVELADTG